MKGRWYEAVGGVGLEVYVGTDGTWLDDDDGWRLGGLILKKQLRYEVQLDRQECSYTSYTTRNLTEAKKKLMSMCKVDQIEGGQGNG